MEGRGVGRSSLENNIRDETVNSLCSTIRGTLYLPECYKSAAGICLCRAAYSTTGYWATSYGDAHGAFRLAPTPRCCIVNYGDGGIAFLLRSATVAYRFAAPYQTPAHTFFFSFCRLPFWPSGARIQYRRTLRTFSTRAPAFYIVTFAPPDGDGITVPLTLWRIAY